jgi:glutamate racemase
MSARLPTIGVFDSGFGGLTVLKALLKVAPCADYAYFGDTARLPYGSKSVETVARYAVEAAHFLEGHGAESAASVTQNKKVVVVGTEATVSSHAYRKALEARGLEAREKACPLLVPLVEEGWVEHPVTEEVARIYLGQAFADGFGDADTLVLGCTHYPLLKPLLRRVAPAHAKIVDSADSTAQAVASHLHSLLPPASALDERRCAPRLKFFATDSVEKFQRLGERFLGQPIENVQHVDLRE